MPKRWVQTLGDRKQECLQVTHRRALNKCRTWEGGSLMNTQITVQSEEMQAVGERTPTKETEQPAPSNTGILSLEGSENWGV